MLFIELKTYGKQQQFSAVDEGLRTVKFIRNQAIPLWMNYEKVNKFDLY